MRLTKAQVEKLPEDHPERMRYAGVVERKEREKGAAERNRKRMKKMREASTEEKG